jgi:hypothetical protein
MRFIYVEHSFVTQINSLNGIMFFKILRKVYTVLSVGAIIHSQCTGLPGGGHSTQVFLGEKCCPDISLARYSGMWREKV